MKIYVSRNKAYPFWRSIDPETVNFWPYLGPQMVPGWSATSPSAKKTFSHKGFQLQGLFCIMFLVSLSLNPSSNLSSSWRLRKPLILLKMLLLFVAPPTINLPLIDIQWSWNSVFKFFSTQLEEIWRKKLGFPPPPPLLTPSLNRVKTNNSTCKQHRKLTSVCSLISTQIKK